MFSHHVLCLMSTMALDGLNLAPGFAMQKQPVRAQAGAHGLLRWQVNWLPGWLGELELARSGVEKNKSSGHLYSTRPCLMAARAACMPPGSTRVPSLGLGIMPRGPSTRAIFVSCGIIARVPKHMSNVMADAPFCCICAISSASPMTSAPVTAALL